MKPPYFQCKALSKPLLCCSPSRRIEVQHSGNHCCLCYFDFSQPTAGPSLGSPGPENLLHQQVLGEGASSQSIFSLALWECSPKAMGVISGDQRATGAPGPAEGPARGLSLIRTHRAAHPWRRWQALWSARQWLSRTLGGVAQGWERGEQGREAVTAPSQAPWLLCRLCSLSCHTPSLFAPRTQSAQPPPPLQASGAQPSPPSLAPRPAPLGACQRGRLSQPRLTRAALGAGERAAGFSQRNGVPGRAEVPYLSPRGRAPAPAPASCPLGASCRGLGPSSWTPTCCPGPAVGRAGGGGRPAQRSSAQLSSPRRAPPPPAAPVPE